MFETAFTLRFRRATRFRVFTVKTGEFFVSGVVLAAIPRFKKRHIVSGLHFYRP
jgi:hypothetical protein